MKSVFRVFCGILLAGALLLAACGDNGGGGDNGPPPSALGEKVKINGAQVYDGGNGKSTLTGVTLTEIFSDNPDHEPWNTYFSAIPALSMADGGKLTLEMGAPKAGALANIRDQLPSGVNASSANAKYFNLMSFIVEKDGTNYDLGMGKGESDLAIFVYTTDDVTINGTGPIEGGTGIWDLDLRTGWNTVLINMNEATKTMTQKSGGLNGYRWYITVRS